MNCIEWVNRRRYTCKNIHVVEMLDDTGRYSNSYKIVGLIRHRWWFYSLKQLDNPFRTSDEITWNKSDAVKYAKRWLNYFESPHEYDHEKKDNIVFDEEVKSKETHPEHYI